MRVDPEAMILAQAVTPGIVFLILAQWSLALAWVAYVARRRTFRPAIAGSLGGASAALALVAATGALFAMSGKDMGPWRAYLPWGLAVALCCRGRLALLPRPLDPRSRRPGYRRAAAVWRVLTLTAHACVLGWAAKWFCYWFASRHCVKLGILYFVDARLLNLDLADWHGQVTRLLWTTVAANGLVGALLLGTLALAAIQSSMDGRAIHASRRRVRLACLWTLGLVALRLAAMAYSLGVGLRFEPWNAGHFFRSLGAGGMALLVTRVLLGVGLVGSHALTGLGATRRGDADGAAALFLPSLIMAAIGEALGAGLTIALLGLGM